MQTPQELCFNICLYHHLASIVSKKQAGLIEAVSAHMIIPEHIAYWHAMTSIIMLRLAAVSAVEDRHMMISHHYVTTGSKRHQLF